MGMLQWIPAGHKKKWMLAMFTMLCLLCYDLKPYQGYLWYYCAGTDTQAQM